MQGQHKHKHRLSSASHSSITPLNNAQEGMLHARTTNYQRTILTCCSVLTGLLGDTAGQKVPLVSCGCCSCCVLVWLQLILVVLFNVQLMLASTYFGCSFQCSTHVAVAQQRLAPAVLWHFKADSQALLLNEISQAGVLTLGPLVLLLTGDLKGR